MKFWWQEQSWVFTAQSLQNVKKCANSGCCTVGRLGSANQPFCAHKAECQTHTKDLLGWGCILGRAGTDGKRGVFNCSYRNRLASLFDNLLAALAALCIPTLVTDCYDPFLIKSLPDLGEVIGMVGEIRASGEGDKHMRRKGNT